MSYVKKSKSLTELVTKRLRKAIIENEYMLGEALSENSLALKLGTSKTPVREALALLKSEGLVNVYPQKGTYVFTLSLEELKELIEIRLILESSALNLANKRNRENLLRSLGERISVMRDSLLVNDIDTYLLNDGEFHKCFFKYCDNRFLSDSYQMISGKSEALTHRISYRPNHPNKTYEEHEEIFFCLNKNNIENACKALESHLSTFEMFYIDQQGELVKKIDK